MGSFIIFDMDFETTKDRLNFEAYLKKHHFCCIALTDYHKDEDHDNYIVYYVGFMGYAEPEMILKKCLKEKIKITFMAWLPISDSGSKWEKLRGRW